MYFIYIQEIKAYLQQADLMLRFTADKLFQETKEVWRAASSSAIHRYTKIYVHKE